MIKKNTIIFEKNFYIHPIFSNYATSKDGEMLNTKRERILNLSISNRGYKYFCVFINSKKKKYFVPRFAWERIKGEILNDKEIDHINEIKLDNRICNLQLLAT